MYINYFYLMNLYLLLFIKIIISIIIPIKCIINNYDNFFFKTYLKLLSSNFTINMKQKQKYKSTVFVMNHHSVHDTVILSYVIDDLYIVAKDDIFTSNYKSRILSYFSNYIYKLLKLIPYKRGDKISGKKCRHDIIYHLNRGNNICIFPEGGSKYSGLPNLFYNGIFQIVFENSFNIVPCSIKYTPPIGIDPGNKLNVLKDIYTNPIIKLDIMNVINYKSYLSTENLKTKCYRLICDNLKSDN